MSNFLSFHKKRIIFKSFIESQFKYSPLIWMFYSRKTNSKINRLHERALRIVYSDYNCTFNELLEKDGSFNIHHQNIQRLMIEIFKIKNDLSDSPLKQYLTFSNRSSRNETDFIVPSVNTVLKGKNSLRYLGPILWNSLPLKIRDISKLTTFTTQIKKWKPEHCPCRLCADYIRDVGFVTIIE